MRVTIQVTGIDDFLRRLHALNRNYQALIRRRFNAALDRTAQRGKQLAPRAPEDGGTLEASVRRTPLRTRGGNVFGAVIAGGDVLRSVLGRRRANVYAIIQHNRPARHKKGRDSYLSIPAAEEGKRLVLGLREDAAREAARASSR